MRVLLWSFSTYPVLGGVERHVHTLAKRLLHEGHTVCVLADLHHQKNVQEKKIDDVEYIYFPFTDTFKRLLGTNALLQKLCSFLVTFAPDIVHIHDMREPLAFFQKRVLNQLDLPFLLTIHTLFEKHHHFGPNCMQLFSHAAHVVFVSTATKENIKKHGLTHPHTSVIYNGISPSTAPFSANTRGNILLFGRLHIQKGFDIALEAFAHLVQEYPTLTLSIVGRGEEEANLKALAHSLHLEKNVTFFGGVHPERVTSHIDAAEIVLIPSRFEPFGLVALEAMSRAKPIVASNIDGLKEIVTDTNNGLLVPPKCPTELAQKTAHLLKNPSYANKLGDAGKRTLETHFLDAHMTKKYIFTYQKCKKEDLCSLKL